MNKPVSLDELARAFSRAFPDLNTVAPLRVLGEGFSSIALETADGMIFRVARHAQAGAKYVKEARLLPLLKPYLPVAIPEPVWLLRSSKDFPFGIIGYRKLPGEPMDPRRMSEAQLRAAAGQLGEIIYVLQNMPLKNFSEVVSEDTRRAEWMRMRAVSSPALIGALTRVEYQKVQDWWRVFLADARMHRFQAVFLHGDLWIDNLLMEGERITGLLDFEEAGPGDPAQDFVPQLYLGQRFFDWVLEAFQKAGGAVDDDFNHRLRHLWAVREFGGLVYAIEQDPTEFADAIEKIRRGPILSPRGLDGWGGL